MVKYLVSMHRPWSSLDTTDKSLPTASEARLAFPDPVMGLQLSRQMSSLIRVFFLPCQLKTYTPHHTTHV